MYQNERLESITELVRQYGYVTVKYLASVLHYSTATINRDLNALEGRGVLKRTYGGVEITDKHTYVPRLSAIIKAVPEKLNWIKKAAELIGDGETVSSTQAPPRNTSGSFSPKKRILPLSPTTSRWRQEFRR